MWTQPGVDGLGELDHVAGALDVGDPLGLGVRRSCRRSPRGGRGGRRRPRARSRSSSETPSRGSERSPTMPTIAVVVGAPAVAQLLEPALRALADEHVDRPLALEQELDQVAADEAGGAGYEVAHCSSSIAAARQGRAYYLADGLRDRTRPRRPRRARRQARAHRRLGGRRDRAWSPTAPGAGPRRARLPGVLAADLARRRKLPPAPTLAAPTAITPRPRSSSCAAT